MEDQINPVKMYNLGSDGNDASNPESTAHIQVDRHGLLDTKEHSLAESWRPLALKVMCIPMIASNTLVFASDLEFGIAE